MFRRAKLRLDLIPAEVAARIEPGVELHATVALRMADGSPLCGTSPVDRRLVRGLTELVVNLFRRASPSPVQGSTPWIAPSCSTAST